MKEFPQLKNYPADALEQYDSFKDRVRTAFMNEGITA
jgi:hypothetical protein